MNIEEKIALIEDMLELDEGTLKEDMLLGEIEEWDSMAYLSFSVLMREEFGKKVSASEIKEFKTLQDLLNVMC